MSLTSRIKEAFSKRDKPVNVIPPDAPPTDEYQDALHFYGLDRYAITCQELDDYPSAVSAFTSEAFLYYLPGIYVAGMNENRADMQIYSTLVYGLDRSNMPSSWDDHFLKRWARLTPDECRASQDWLLWLRKFDGLFPYGNELSRAFDTLTVISNSSHAYPLARRP
jgi:hypothetical protein